jgi:Alr-MurF fusion protein
MQFNLSEIAALLPSNLLTKPEVQIRQISYDSRKIIFAEKTLFFALNGRLDGHAYLQHAYEQGVRNFVVEKNTNVSKLIGANIFFTKNPLNALQLLAAYHRRKFDLETIAITGSNGKTIVKDWISQLLDNEYIIVKSPRSYNSQLGVAISVLGIEKRHNLGIFEAGISQANEMENLEKMIAPELGILTNIGDAHNEGFVSLEQKIEEKIQLFQHVKTIICNAEYLPFLEKKYPDKAFFCWKKTTTFSLSNIKNVKHNFLNIFSIEKNHNNFTTIKAFFENKEIQIVIPFSDYPSVENAITCWFTMLYKKYSQDIIEQRMLQLQPVALRMEIKAGVNGCIIINDAYNLDLTSLSYGLDFLNQQAKSKKTLILSDIFQSGLSDEKLYSKVENLIQEKQIDKLILIGEKSHNYLTTKILKSYYKSTEVFLKEAKFSDFNQETILLKGARAFEFERIAAFLSQKAHRTVLEINLDSLRHNLNVYDSFLQTNVKMLVMVKASAYGSGSTEVAKLLEYQQVDYLGVAYADEGVALRKEGINLPILVLNPEESSFPALLRYNLEPEIYCFSELERFLLYLKNNNQTLCIHLKLDTGMHRLGFEKPDIQLLILILKENKNIVVKSIFSHLAASDTAEHDDFTSRQVALFSEMYEQIVSEIGYRPLRHICNTGGITRFPQYHFDMVRLGIGIYGVDSNSSVQSQLETVNTLKATISQIKNIAKGESIGYSRKGLADKDLRIATISIGYADGFLRAAGNGRYSLAVNGQLAPVIGNVCMDMTMIDITNLTNVKEGDEVVVFGDFPRVETLAEATQTIAYEVLTNVSDRVKRVYFSA